jgi:hypothetical protein
MQNVEHSTNSFKKPNFIVFVYCLFNYYFLLTSNVYNPELPHTYKTVCVKCHKARPLVTLCAASALSLYIMMTFLLFFVVMHYLVFNSLYTIFLCILQLTRGTRYWSFGFVGAPFLFLGKLNK